MCATYIAAYPALLRPAASILTLHLSEALCHLTYTVHGQDSDMDQSAVLDSFKIAFGLLKKIARCFYGARKALTAITTSYSALKRVSIASNTLVSLVDFVAEEHEALRSAASAAETTAAQRQAGSSTVAPQPSNTIQTPVSGNEDTALAMDLEQFFDQSHSLSPWPMMGDVTLGTANLGTMENFDWPDLEWRLERVVTQQQ